MYYPLGAGSSGTASHRIAAATNLKMLGAGRLVHICFAAHEIMYLQFTYGTSILKFTSVQRLPLKSRSSLSLGTRHDFLHAYPPSQYDQQSLQDR